MPFPDASRSCGLGPARLADRRARLSVTSADILRRASVVVIALLAAAPATQAQSWPSRPVRLVVPQSPGASTDLIARVLAARLGEALGQQVVVDNRPGAGSILGTRLVIDAEPDGHTLLVVAASITINPSLHRKPPFDAARDLAPITQLSVYPNLLVVHPSVPVTSVQGLIALAKRPGVSLNYGSSGSGTGTHLSAELFRFMTGVNLTHVPYKGGGPSVQALLGAEVQLAFATLPSVLTSVRAGKLRALAVTTSERSSTLPDVPTVAESGVAGYEHRQWNGFLAPARTPRAVVDRLHREAARIVQGREVRDLLAREGAEPVGNTPEAFAAMLKAETARMAAVIRSAGIQAD